MSREIEALRDEISFERALAEREASGERRLQPQRRQIPRSHSWPRRLLTTRAGWVAVLALVFVANLVETWAETWLRSSADSSQALGYKMAAAFHGLEGWLSFEQHEATSPIAIYGYSVAYFFLPPLLGLAVAYSLARRQELAPFRIFSLAIAFAYAISLPFYLFVPVPERWSYPPSGATLLSDQWSVTLIETLRPISGLDNSFPSFHAAFTVILVLSAYLFALRFRTVLLVFGAMILLSTFVLGIHWLPDILAGVAVGVLSVAAAWRIEPWVARSTME